MRALIFGGDGMLGHELQGYLSASHDVRVTLRQPLDAYAHLRRFTQENAYAGVDVRDLAAVEQAVTDFRPDAVVNATGLVRQRPEARDRLPAIHVNALFPQQLAVLTAPLGIRVVHISTDCVFSGTRGHYTEADPPDPVDVYGMTKTLGEVVDADHVVNLRTSMIGLELARRTSLIEWALAQRGRLTGYARAVFNGLTTTEASRVIEQVLERHPDLNGVWHVSGEPISKFELLRALFERLERDVEVVPSDDVACDRTLCSDAFRQATGWDPPTWDDMLTDLTRRIRQRDGS